MSEIVAVALISALPVAVVGLAGLAFSYWTHERESRARAKEQQAEREERYRTMLYEKRLAVHQDAYKWMLQLIEPSQRALELTTGGRDLPDGISTQLADLYQNAREWWDGNCLYLDEESRGRTINFIEQTGSLVRLDRDINWKELYQLYKVALRAIQEGIGKKHIEEAEQVHPHD